MKISIRSIRLIAVTLLLSLSGAQFAIAAETKYFDARDRVSTGSDLTYFDLVLQITSGLGKTPVDGSEITHLRHLGGDEYPTSIANPSLGSVERLDIKLGGRPALLLMFDLGYADDSVASVNVLALFDMSGRPRLLDAMDVGLDRETSFIEPGYMELSPELGMAFVRNSHHNAGEEYLQTSLVGVWDGRLHEVDTVGSYSWLAADEDTQVRPSFAVAKDAVAVDATFSIRRRHCDGGCVPDGDYPSTTERVTGRYRWDAGKRKFVRPEHAFDKVPQANMEE